MHTRTSTSLKTLCSGRTGGQPQPERTVDAVLLLVGTYLVSHMAEEDAWIRAGFSVHAKACDVDSIAAQRLRQQQQQPQPEQQHDKQQHHHQRRRHWWLMVGAGRPVPGQSVNREDIEKSGSTGRVSGVTADSGGLASTAMDAEACDLTVSACFNDMCPWQWL